MNLSLRNLISKIKEFAQECDLIQGMYLMSSVVADRDGYFSVARIVLYLDEYQMLNAISEKLKQYVLKRCNLLLTEKSDDALVLITNDLTRIDVEFSFPERISQDVQRYIDSGATDYRPSLVLDKQELIAQEIEKHWFDRKQNIAQELDRLAHAFMEQMYQFRLYTTRGDEWRAYKVYVKLWDLTGSMMLLSAGKYKYLHNPKFLLSYKTIHPQALEEFFSLQTELFTSKMMMKARKMAQIFQEHYQKAAKRWQVPDNWQQVQGFLTALDQKFYPLVNFRDFAKIVNFCYGKPFLQSGKVFRSGYWGFEDKEQTRKVFENHNIQTVIDLRNSTDRQLSDEQGKPFYIDFVPRYYNVELEALDFEKTVDFVGSFSPSKNNYYGIIEYQAQKVGQILRLIAEFVDSGAVLVHCIAGRDRTGVVIAILQKLLGVSDQCIIEDYMSTFFGVRREYIEFLLNTLQTKYGGVERWAIEKAGLSQAEIATLNRKLRQ